MKPISIILAIGTITLIASQLLCGFWLTSKESTSEGVAFHRKLGIGASTLALATSVMMIFIVSL